MMDDDDDDDDVVCVGTPVEELIDEDDVRTLKAPRVEDQIVTDKQGRRRFHGAFTGGFSAGYFNSVGTKEGWTPSVFVSSKAQRSEAKKARPQDYMDEEDLESFGIAPQGIQTSADYDRSEPVKRKRVTDPSGPIPGTPVLEELLRPTRDTMGMRLLRSLGWRPGQGVGPRVTKREKKAAKREEERKKKQQQRQQQQQQQQQSLSGVQKRGGLKDDTSEIDDSASSDDGDDGDDKHKDITFAPCDVPELSRAAPKSDVFGIGYTPLSRTRVLGGHINLFDPQPFALKEKKKKLLIQGQAFGVGAFENEDEDIYATEDMSNYDFGEDREEEERKQNKPTQHNMEMLGIVKAIEGFRLSSQPIHQNKIYPPPVIPPGFVPLYKPQRKRFERKESELRGLGRHMMTPDQRKELITDKPKATVEIRTGIKGQHPPQHHHTTTTTTTAAEDIDKIYEEFKSSDKKLGSDFKPFASVPEKQKRYELYLRMKEKGQKDRFYLAQPKTMTEWEKEREVQGFSRAAKLFQPLVSAMATRFVTAASSDSHSTLKDGLNTTIPKSDAETSKGGLLDPVEAGDERTAAARSGMYGNLTQTKEEWYPDSLLCRRFNVPKPYPDSKFVGTRKINKKDKGFMFGLEDTEETTAGMRASKWGDETKQQQQQQEEEEEEEEEERIPDKPEDYGLKVPVDGPPTMDLFKAIFQDSDSDSDSEENTATTAAATNEDNNNTTTTSSSNSSQPTTFTANKGRDGASEMESHVFENSQRSSTTITTTTTTTTTRARQRPSRFEPPLTHETESRNETGKQRQRPSRFEPLSHRETGNETTDNQGRIPSRFESQGYGTNDETHEQGQGPTHSEALKHETSDDDNETETKQTKGAHSLGTSIKDNSGDKTKTKPDEPSNQPADIANKHSFIPRSKKDPYAAKPAPAAHGIFANVDLVALNSYRTQRLDAGKKEEEEEEEYEDKRPKKAWPESVIKAGVGRRLDEEGALSGTGRAKGTNDGDSSTDSDDLYGPAPPSHLKNRLQVIQSGPGADFRPQEPIERQQSKEGWVERTDRRMKHKHKSRSKSKKERKKKKEKKSKKQKEKKRKKKKGGGSQSSSRSKRSGSGGSSSGSSGRSSSSSDSD